MSSVSTSRAMMDWPTSARMVRHRGADLPFGYWKRRKLSMALIALTHIPIVAWTSHPSPMTALVVAVFFFAWMWTLVRTRTLRGWSVRLPAEVIADLLRVFLVVGVPGTLALIALGEPIWLGALAHVISFCALTGQALFLRGRPASWVRIVGSPSCLNAAVGTFAQCMDLLGSRGCRFAMFRADKPDFDAWQRRIGAWLERGETVLILEKQLRPVGLKMRECGDVILADDCLLFTSMENPSGPIMNRLLGLLNRIIALLAVATMWPIALVLALLIKMHDGGPVLFAQERVGLQGRRFTLYKFRTMRCDAERYGESPREDLDPRVTSIGRWMRRLSLDELPQLYNVFRGQMRLVGPRPEMPFIVAQYDERQKQRLRIKPGITGLWQVSPHRNDPIHEHVEYDLAYIAHRRPILDIALIIATLGLASRSGA